MALSYAFDASKGETPETIRQRRRVVDAMLARISSPPETIGGGIEALGQGIAAAMMNRKADRAERAGMEQNAAAWGPVQSALEGKSAYPPAPAQSGNVSSDPAGYRDAIASIESAGSGDYGAIGPTNSKMGRALGRYQIMESNIAPWAKEALGREISADEFLSNPQIQDSIFDHKFGGYVNQFGPEGAAQAWFAGPGGVGKLDRKDVLGTDVGSYGKRFMSALGNRAPVQVASLDPNAGLPATAPAPTASPVVDAIAQQQMSQAQPSLVQAPMPEAAGNVPDQGGGPDLGTLLRAAADPFMNENQSSVIRALIAQRMKASDPEAGLDAEYKRAQIDNMRSQINERNNPDARAKFGLNPQYGVDANGNPVLLQLGEDGSAHQTAMPEGVTLSKEPMKLDAGTHYILLDPITRQNIGTIPKDVSGEAAATAVGKGAGEAQLALPGAEGLAEQVKTQALELAGDPYLENMLGPLASRLPNVTADSARVQAKIDQLQGGAFLQAREMLKGAGQVTDYEGRKAEEAYVRLSTAQNADDFKAALKDFTTYIDMGLKKLRAQASMGSGAPAAPQNDSDPLGIR